MVCRTDANNTPHEGQKRFKNWAGSITFTASDAYRPSSRGEVVELIAQAEENNRRIQWTGSIWSFNPGFVSEDMIVETTEIKGVVPSSLVLGKLSLASSYDMDHLVHVRGGTKVFNLNRILHGLDPAPSGGQPDEIDLDCLPHSKALQTLGGSGGQSIAGLLATGSHGGDVHLPPMADAVAAIHLIGPGGQEWWIERGSRPLTAGTANDTTQVLREHAKLDATFLAEICSDIVVRKDDDFFDSVLVSIGRMGFVYALVIETVDGFKLSETRVEDVWESYSAANLTSPRFEPFLMEREAALGTPLHFLQVLINPFARRNGTHGCKVAERTVAACTAANQGMDNVSTFDLTGYICRQHDTRVFLPYLIAIEVAISASSAALMAAGTALLAIPIVGWALAAGFFAAAAALVPVWLAVGAVILTIMVNPRMTSGELVALISNFAFRYGFGSLMTTVLGLLFDSSYPTGPAQAKRGVSWKIMDTYGYGAEDYCQKVDSFDFAFDIFDTSTGGYLRFIQEVLEIFDDLTGRGRAIAGLVALRYTRRTTAKLGISRFYITCHVEIPILRGLAGNSEFMARARAAALRHGGVCSWGQAMDGYSAGDIVGAFGNDLSIWRQTLRELVDHVGAADATFSNDFYRRMNLEPA